MARGRLQLAGHHAVAFAGAEAEFLVELAGAGVLVADLEVDGLHACLGERLGERVEDFGADTAAAHGGVRDWGRAFAWMGMPDEYFASAGNRPIAERLYRQADITSADIDVALLYDHFTPMVIMQLEDYGFCERGDGGAFVEGGAIRYDGGSIPVNTHGGQLSEAYVVGMTHIVEGVEQMRGTAVNQVGDAELALVTGGPASIPVSGLVLGRDS